MAFVQKDRFSRKDKLEKNQAGPGPTPPEEARRPRFVVRTNFDGTKTVQLDIPEGATHKEAHLDELLARLEQSRDEEQQKD